MRAEQGVASQSLASLLSGCELQLSALLGDMANAAKEVAIAIAGAGVTGQLGGTGMMNVQGEAVQQLDALADRIITYHLKSGGNCAGIVSEEREDILPFESEAARQSRYVVLFDPLDGSSNIAAQLSIGTIFSVYRRRSRQGVRCDENDFLQPGNRQVAAGYVLYSCATVFVYACGGVVNGFTLDPITGDFRLSHEDIHCPEKGNTYSVNHGYFRQYSREVQAYLDSFGHLAGSDAKCSQRYVGSLVADIHRTLLQGGVFLYPATRKKPNGKLRLLYECNPLSFVVETARGMATDDEQRILDILPTELHQVTPVYMGSATMMQALTQKLRCEMVVEG